MDLQPHARAARDGEKVLAPPTVFFNVAFATFTPSTAVFVPAVVLGTVLLFRRRLWEFGWYALAALVPTLLGASWQSMPRHSLIAVPAVAA